MIYYRFYFRNSSIYSCLRDVRAEFLDLRLFDLRQESLTEHHEKLEMHGFVLSAKHGKRDLTSEELVLVGIESDNI